MSFLTGYVLGMTLNKNSNGSYHERDFEKEQLKIKCQELENRNADLSKTIERLQEQLAEANEVIIYANNLADAYDEIEKYLKKWGVK